MLQEARQLKDSESLSLRTYQLRGCSISRRLRRIAAADRRARRDAKSLSDRNAGQGGGLPSLRRITTSPFIALRDPLMAQNRLQGSPRSGALFWHRIWWRGIP